MSDDLCDYTLISKYRANTMLRTFITLENGIEQIRIASKDIIDPESTLREIEELLTWVEFDLNSLGEDIDLLVRETGAVNFILEGGGITDFDNDEWLTEYGVYQNLGRNIQRILFTGRSSQAVLPEFVHTADEPSSERYVPSKPIPKPTKSKLFGGVEIVKSIP